jgi:uncharacterized membrane protein YeaQ/YmgE (transglycosylase-associated protein family)
LSRIEPDRKDSARASPNQYFLGKVGAIFLIVGSPIFGLLFSLAVSIANRNADTLYTKISQELGIFFSVYGLFSSYVVGLVPSLMAGLVHSRISRHIGSAGQRVLAAALIGAAVYCLVCALVLYFIYAGRVETDAWLFTIYAAGAGAVAALLCASILEI